MYGSEERIIPINKSIENTNAYQKGWCEKKTT